MVLVGHFSSSSLWLYSFIHSPRLIAAIEFCLKDDGREREEKERDEERKLRRFLARPLAQLISL